MDLACSEALVWNGVEFVTEHGSETDESDSEQPLTESEQVVAIMNTRAPRPPPLPVDRKYAVSTAVAVRNHLLAVPYEKRTIAHDHALRTPITAQRIETWLEQQLSDRRTERTLRYAFCFALNPSRSIAWVAKKAQAKSQASSTAKGLALHLRCHPFTRSDVQRGSTLLRYYWEHRQAYERERLLRRAGCSASLDAAVVLIGFHSRARHFDAHRYQ